MKGLVFSLILISNWTLAQGWGDNDSLRTIELHSRGVKIEKGRVVAWFPKDSLSSQRMQGIVDTLNLGIMKVEALMGAPFSWQVFANKPVVYYFSPEKFVSHASWDGFVYIPFWRIKENKAPWLHEALHLLLRTNTGSWSDVAVDERRALMPLWLTEGLPDYLSAKVAYANNFPRFDLWNDGGLLMADASCVSKLEGEKGDYIIDFVGKAGLLPELFGEDRGKYAPTFYNCSFSFSKYIGEQYGDKILIEAMSDFKNEQTSIEKATGKNLADLKKEWLVKIGWK